MRASAAETAGSYRSNRAQQNAIDHSPKEQRTLHARIWTAGFRKAHQRLHPWKPRHVGGCDVVKPGGRGFVTDTDGGWTGADSASSGSKAAGGRNSGSSGRTGTSGQQPPGGGSIADGAVASVVTGKSIILAGASAHQRCLLSQSSFPVALKARCVVSPVEKEQVGACGGRTRRPRIRQSDAPVRRQDPGRPHAGHPSDPTS